MDKCREAFEAKYRELHPNDKCTLMANGNYSGWIKQAHWWAWQSRQAEVDHLERIISLRDAQLTEEIAISTKWIAENEVKDKRIESALTIVSKMAKATNSTAMWAYDLEKALRGEHEA